MPRGRQSYDAETKANILEAVKAARKEGLKFDAIHKAAAEAGYKGKAASLRVMVSKLGMTKRKGKRGRPKGAKAGDGVGNGVPMAKKRGRPAGKQGGGAG